MAAESFAVHAYLSEQGKTALEVFSADNGVSVTGLLEALALELAEEIDEAGGVADGIREPWVKKARRIDAERRRRDGTRVNRRGRW